MWHADADPADGPVVSRLWMAVRPAPGAPFADPRPAAPGLNAGFNTRSPCLSADGRTLIFDSDRPGGPGQFNLWVARRVPRK